MKIRHQVSKALSLYRALPPLPAKVEEAVTQMLGDPNAQVLMIAPPPDQRCLEHNFPLLSPAQQVLVQMMDGAGIDPIRKFLTVSCSRWGLKANKASTQDVSQFVYACGKAECFRLYICVGSEAFKFIFGGGKKTSMKTLAGSTLHLREFPNARLFVLPDVEPLAPVFNGDRRNDAYLARYQDEARKTFSWHLLTLKGLL